MNKSVIPQENRRLKVSFIMLVPAFMIFLGRWGIHLSLETVRGPYGPFVFIIIPIACGTLLLLSVLILAIVVTVFRRTHQLTPVLVLLGGIIAALLIPLPPFPKVVYPEEAYFFAQRVRFEEVINLARQNKLQCMESGCNYIAHILPPEFKELSSEGHISVYHETQSKGLVVEFSPFDFYYPLIYFEIPEDVNLPWNSRCLGSRWVRKLDEHWYLCVEDWL